MAFQSFGFAGFLSILVLLYSITSKKNRWLLLLSFSLIFYASLLSLWLMFSLTFVTLISFAFGKLLHRYQDHKYQTSLLWLGIFLALLPLILSRYSLLIASSCNRIFSLFNSSMIFSTTSTIASIGISFFVFQAIGYLIDVYLAKILPEYNLGIFFLFICFFPKILQGPIERADKLIPQLKQWSDFNYDNLRLGVMQFTNGLFKKIVVADTLALPVNMVFADVGKFTGLPLLLGIIMYAWQIYFDFSGYTDMAMGVAKMFNIDLTNNFNSPYAAKNIAEFWRRWHISFSQWILDYIFKPLQMTFRKYGNLGNALALMITFVVCGIWHGPTLGFFIWGCLHGIYMATSVLFQPLSKKLNKRYRFENSRTVSFFSMLLTFSMVCFAWIFFRAANIQDAFYIVKNICKIDPGLSINTILANMAWGKKASAAAAVTVAVYFLPLFKDFTRNKVAFFSHGFYRRWFVYYSMAMCILLLGRWGESQFIYFRF
ncbi:MAG: hypothetical protein PHW04_02825 [Candidatus Wallbacteria bacterium]|nr:hypothetical protein [Candidatus Wallbacteria bacterium]